MKNRPLERIPCVLPPPLWWALVMWFALLLPGVSPAQGPLVPPSAPAPSMKTLGQIEPRIAIDTNNTPGDADSLCKIIQPGSYYLTTNLLGVSGKRGIEVTVSGVTIDLNGFELAGVAGSLDGINAGVTIADLAVYNGTVTGWGGDGIDGSSARNGIYQDLRLNANNLVGLRAGEGNVVTRCAARGNSGGGFYILGRSTLSACIANNNTSDGISASSSTLRECAASANTGSGINVESSTVETCTSTGNTLDGIRADSGSVIRGCMASFNTSDGIEVNSDCRVIDNNCVGNGVSGSGAGVHVTASFNRIEANSVTGNDRGIDVDDPGNFIIRNSASDNSGGNYEIVTGNRVGTIVTPPLSGNITGNAPGAGSGATDPVANFVF